MLIRASDEKMTLKDAMSHFKITHYSILNISDDIHPVAMYNDEYSDRLFDIAMMAKDVYLALCIVDLEKQIYISAILSRFKENIDGQRH